MRSTREVALDLVRALDAHDWATVQALVAQDATAHVGGQTLDRAQWLGMGQMFYTAFPDARHEVGDVIVQGDRVVMRYLFVGTHRDDFQGIPASGRPVRMETITIDRVVDGAVVEHWGLFDAVGLMQQISGPSESRQAA